jgi:hypothetical protein
MITNNIVFFLFVVIQSISRDRNVNFFCVLIFYISQGSLKVLRFSNFRSPSQASSVLDGWTKLLALFSDGSVTVIVLSSIQATLQTV